MWSNSQQRLQPQATGWQQPMMTGYPGQQHQQQQQQQHQMPSMPVPMAQRPMQTGYLQQQQQQQPPSHHLLMPQNTGYPGLQQQQQQQPMLGSFSAVPSSFLSTFMPSNPNASWGPAGGGNGVPQLQQQQHHQQQQYQQQQQPAVAPPPSLPQYFQQHNQQTMGQSQVQVQWSLTADERRNYDKIFRAWDSGSGYIDGSRATDVFKESGLEREDLMKIWALSDRENRGKLNLAEFHVAMGLIYRRLSGNPIPDVLPAEMVPPSSKDLDSSVDFLKDLLRKDTNSRSTNLNQSQSDDQSNRYAKIRSFANGASPEPSSAARKDATVYRHNDGDVKTYKSTSRHLDRRNVRFQGEEESSDFDDLKKQLSTSQDLLERSYKAEDDDEDLKAEIDDLKYRIKRVQEDIEFNKSGRRTEGKDNERRRLERELLFLMHEKLPELEDKKREADRRKRSEDRAAARKRDGRNSRSQSSRKYSRKGDSDSSSESNEEDERGYLRGSYGSTGRPPRAASPEHRRSDRKSDTDSHRGANGSERVLSPIPPETSAHTEHARHSSPAPPPPSFAKNDGDAAGSRSSPAASRSSEQSQQSKPPATAEERQAYIRAEAQRRVQERMRMLTGQAAPANGTSAQPSPSTYDSSLQARLEQDKAEAARKAEQEDAVLADRERQRQIKLEEERLRNNTKEKANIAEATKALQQVSIEVTASEMHHAGDDGVAAAAARAEIAAEEKALQAKASIATADANASQERLRELKKPSNPQTKKQPPQPPTSRVTKAPPKPPPPRSKQQVSSIPPEPSRPIDKSSDGVSQEALSSQSPTIYHSATLPSSVSSLVSPPASGPTAAAHKSPSGTTPTKPASTNPFHRLGANSASPALPAAVKGSSNPFFRPPTGASTTAETTATKSPLLQPQAVKPPAPKEDDWGDMHPHQSGNSDDSDDEDGAGAKEKRAGLAGLLFGGTGQSAPSSRPGSAKPPSPSATAKSANTVLPALGAAAGSPPPRAALLGAIQSGARLRKASTNDRSSALGAGTVVDAEPEIEGRQHENRISDAVVTKDSALNTPERSQPEANELASQTSTADKRQSVDWYGGLAADSVNKQAADTTIERLESLNEDAEEDGERVEGIAAQSDEHTSVPGGETLSGDSEDPEAEFDISISKRVRSLYSYEGQRPQDANFSSNQVIVVHPPKDSTSDWLFGQVLSTGSRGWMPKTYVEDLVHDDPATVLYEFDGSSEDELKVSPGMKVEICERLNSDWARVILDGRVGLVPLSYLEEVGTRPHRIGLPLPADVEMAPPESRVAEKLLSLGPQNLQLSSDDSSDTGDSTDDDDNLDLTDLADHATKKDPSAAGDHFSTQAKTETVRLLETAGLRVERQVGTRPKRRPPPPRPRIPLVHRESELFDAQISEQPPSEAGRQILEVPTVDDAYARWQQLLFAEQKEALLRTNGLQNVSSVLDATKRETPPGSVDPMGKTWSSLVAPDALQSFPQTSRKRQEAIFELIMSESAFLKSMQLVVEKWFRGLQAMLDDEVSAIIFANLEEILLWSTSFLSTLEERQKECRLYVDRVGDIVQSHAEGLSVYQSYCLNQANTMRTLAEVRRSQPDVDAVARERLNNLTLEHFLLEPVQRLARYPLLFEQILKFSDDGDSREIEDLRQGVDTAKGILQATNEAIRQQENDEKLVYLSDSLTFPEDPSIAIDLTTPTQFLGPRQLLKEGPLQRTHRHRRASRRKDLYAYLFNDMLLLVLQTSSADGVAGPESQEAARDADLVAYKAPLPLDEVHVKEAYDQQAIVLSHRGVDLRLKAPSPPQHQAWLKKLKSSRDEAIAIRKNIVGNRLRQP